MSKKKKRPPLPVLGPGIFAIDSHCHLDMSAYGDDCSAVIDQAFSAGLSHIITIGIDLQSSRKALEIACSHPRIYATVGVHPHNVGGVREEDYEIIQKIAKNKKVVGYGEIGIDLAKEYEPKSLQIEHFIRQVRLAKKCQLPLVIHDRDAHQKVMDILEREAPFPFGGVMHCFSGDMDLAQRVLRLGFCISIPGVVTFPNAPTLQEVVKNIDLDWLLVETDGPFLSPVPMRGKRNVPANVLYTAQKIAELRGEDLDYVVKKTTANTLRIFRMNQQE